jgi:spore germination protein YaaH
LAERALDRIRSPSQAFDMTRRPFLGVGVVAVVVISISVVLAFSGAPDGESSVATASPSTDTIARATPTPVPTIRPEPGHELFGYLPYWEMDAGISAHLDETPLTTLALFSVTHKKNGTVNTAPTGYQRITGPLGRQLIAEAHDRGVEVQIVYTSFGTARNDRLFGKMKVQDRSIASLVALVDELGVDGVSVDVEQVHPDVIPAYGSFVGRLRDALRAVDPMAQVSVATTAGRTGAAMAAAASDAGADRIFLMGYDYHYSSSEVGASAPMDRRDGADADLVWSLDLYESVGVPVERTILGLPLYGYRWRVTGPEIGAPRLGNGADWVPADNPKFLADPPLPPEIDPIEVVEFYAVPPSVEPKPGDSRATAGWQAIYVDSPRTLEPKFALADERGLAGVGLWAIGYERGLDGYRSLFRRFLAGELE